MAPPGGQRPPFHQQQPSSAGPQQQPGGPPGSQMMVPQQQPGYPPMYRDSNSYPSSQAGGMGTSSSTHPPGFPTGSQSNMPAAAAPTSTAYSQSPGAGGNQSQISAANMGQPMQNSSSAGPLPRYPASKRPYQTPTRGALSAMLSNSSSGPDPRTPHGHQWRQRPPMLPPGYSSSPSAEPTSRRHFPMQKQAPPPRKEIVFPPGSVEATKMTKTQRRILRSKDIAKLDSDRLTMCLQSGLLCESIWAIDSITVMLQDDNTSMYLSLINMPGLLDALIAHYKQSLALMFEELADLARDEHNPGTQTIDQSEPDPDCKQTLLGGTNYSWCARNGMKVIVDTEPKGEHPPPSPAMYNKKVYISHNSEHMVVSTYETGDSDELYSKHCRRHVTSNNIDRENSTNSISSVNSRKDDTIANESSPVPDRLLSEEKMYHSHVDKRVLADGCIGQFPVYNGCISHDVKVELDEHSCESAGSCLSNNKIVTDTEHKPAIANVDIKQESAIDKKVAKSSLDLEVLEAKLSLSRKRRFSETIDIEPIVRDDPPLESDVDLKLEEIAIRCVSLANIFRSLSFVTSNEKLLAETTELLHVFGRLLSVRTHVDARQEKRHWWWPTLEVLREHTLVALSNVSGYVQLIGVSHEICFPLLDSLLFWGTTTAAYARDPLPHTHSLCIRNLVMEILCKMCAHCDNMNLLLFTPPHDRINLLFQCLAKLLSEPDQVRREFALVIVSCLAQADAMAARGLAMQSACVSQLISILESAESAAFAIAQQRGVGALRDKPEAMGTSLDMIRRTSATLVEMAQVEDNHCILLKQQDRLLNLVMSQILDQHVAKMLSDVLYECTKDSKTNIPPSYVISETIEKAESVELEQEGSVKEEAMEETSPSSNCTDSIKINEESELDKENINKPTLETNHAIGMISAAS